MSCAQACKQDDLIHRNVKTAIEGSESVLSQYLNPIVECECMLVDSPLCLSDFDGQVKQKKLRLPLNDDHPHTMIRRQPRSDTDVYHPSVYCSVRNGYRRTKSW